MARTDRIRRAGVVAVLAVVLLLALTPAAYAASTYFDQTPGVGAISDVALPLISVKVSDPAGISTGYQIKVDGVSRTPKVTWGPNKSYCQLSYQQTSALKNGAHTVYASVFTGAGRTSTTWSFTTRVLPVVGPLVPADGSTTTSQKPTISAGVIPNGVALGSYSLTVDGAAVAATYDAVAKTVSYTPSANLANDTRHTAVLSVTDATGVSTSVTWGFDVQIYADMADTAGCTDCHLGFPAVHPMDDCLACHADDAPEPAYFYLDFTYRHSADYLAIYDCTYCHSSVFPNVPIHVTDIAGTHITTSDMSACSCHVRSLTNEHARYTRPDGSAITCVTCHASADPAIQAGMAVGSTACATCHTIGEGHPYGEVDHIADVGETADASGKLCGQCHYMDLAAEHDKSTSSSAGIACATCHPQPRASFTAWSQGCSEGSCHAVGSATEIHAGADAAHASPVPAPTCVAAGCHDGSVAAVHAEATTTTPEGATVTSCSVCHTLNVAPTKQCATCHPDADTSGHEAVHVVARTDSCLTCHVGDSLTTVHMDGVDFTCATCHSSTDAEVVAAIAAGNLACSACHVTMGVDFHVGLVTTHTAPVADYESCGHCHHGWGSNPIKGPDITRHAGGCETCHNDTFDLTGKTAHCADCHVAEGAGTPPDAFHRETEARHSPLDSASQDCARCHETTNVRVLHEAAGCDTCHATYSCGECHNMHAGVGIALGQGLYCSRCHATEGTDYHADFAAKHPGAPAGCTEAACHAATSLVAVHAAYVGPDGTYPQYEDTCALCHTNDDPDRIPADATADCASCHGPEPHPNHTLAGPCIASGCHVADAGDLHDSLGAPGPGCPACHGVGITPSFVCSDCHSAPHADENHGSGDRCVSCHSTGNLITVHGDNCSTCHPTPAAPGTVYTGCEQAGCHPGAHADVSGHNSNHGEGDDCWSCHPYEYDAGCGSCHPDVYERVAPVTTSDAQASYTSYAVIHLAATDQGEYGWVSGVRTTYFRVDGGPLRTGSTAVAAATGSGSGTHTLEYWSVDRNANTEAHHVVRFSVATGPKDTIAPTGTMAVNNGTAYVSTVSTTLNSAVADAQTEVVSMRVDPGTGTFGLWTDFSAAYPITLPAGNGPKTVRAEYADVGGNILALSDGITLDATPPSGTILINSGAQYTNSLTVTLDLSATDALSGVAQMRFLDNGNWAWSDWEPYATSKSYTLHGTFTSARNVYVQYRDNAGAESSMYGVLDAIVWDGTPPAGTMSVNGGATFTTSDAVVLNSAITDTGGSGVYQMRIDPGSGTFGAPVAYSPSYPFTLTAGDGLKTVRAEYSDNAGNTAIKIHTIALGAGADAIAPSGSISINAGASSATNAVVTLTLSAVDTGGSGLSQMRLSNDNATWSEWEAYATTKSWTLGAGDGNKTVYVQYRDFSGNGSISYSDAIFLDSTPPTGTIVINGGATNTSTTAAVLTLSYNGDAYRMRFSNNGTSYGGWQGLATNMNWTLLAGDGLKTVYVQYVDWFGNISTFSDTITLGAFSDTTAPTGSVVINGGAGWASSTFATLTLSANDTGGSGLNQMRFSNDGVTWGSWSPYATTGYWTMTSGSGTKTVYTQFRDFAGNVSATYSDTIVLDVTLPTGSIVIDAGAASTMNEAVTLTLAASDGAGSGLGQMRFSNNNTTWEPWEAYATSKAWTLSAGSGLKTVYVQYRDNVGNVSVSYSDTITRTDDVVATATTSLPLNAVTWVDADSSAYDPWAQYLIYVNDVLIGVKSASADPNWACPEVETPSGGHIDIVVDCGFNEYNWIFEEARPNTFTMTLPAGTVRLDAATWTGFPNMQTATDWYDPYDDYYTGVWLPEGTISNIVYAYPASGDMVAPTGSISVNAGAAFTNTTASTLTLAAADTGGSGLSQMRFSNDNTSWSAWEAYGTSKSWALTAGSGAKTVYVQYRDVAGNVSASYSDAITLDAAAPTGSISINGGAATTASTSVSLTLAASDTGGSGLSQMRFSNDNTTWSAWETNAASKAWTLTTGDGVKTVYVQYRDAAGNVSSSYSDTITLSTAVANATLAFEWWGWGYAELHVEDSSGVTIASTTVEGSMSDLAWYVTVPAGQNYYMVCDYYYDDDTGGEGWSYGVWSNDVGINPDGVLSPGETVTWNY